MSVRQQRNRQNRRAIQPAQQRVNTDIETSFAGFNGTQLEMAWIETQPNLVITGIPQVRLSNPDSLPLSVAANQVSMILTYAAPPVVPYTLTLAQQDPAIRTPAGGFVAPFEVITQAGPPTVDWSPTIESDQVIRVTSDGIQLSAAPWPNTNFTVLGRSAITDVQIDGTDILLTFPVPPLTAGEILQLNAASASQWRNDGFLLVPTTHPLP